MILLRGSWCLWLPAQNGFDEDGARRAPLPADWFGESQAGDDADRIRADECLAVFEPAGERGGLGVGVQAQAPHGEDGDEVRDSVTVRVTYGHLHRFRALEAEALRVHLINVKIRRAGEKRGRSGDQAPNAGVAGSRVIAAAGRVAP